MSEQVNQETEVKRRGRPATFPDQETAMGAFNLPVETLDLLREFSDGKERTRNSVVDSAIRSYISKNS